MPGLVLAARAPTPARSGARVPFWPIRWQISHVPLVVIDLLAGLHELGRRHVAALERQLLGRLRLDLGDRVREPGIAAHHDEREDADLDAPRGHRACSGVPVAAAGNDRRGAWPCAPGPPFSPRPPSQKMNMHEREERDGHHGDHVGRVAERGGDRVGRRVAQDAVDVPVLADARAREAHEAHEPREGHGQEDQHVLRARARSCPSGSSPVERAPLNIGMSMAITMTMAQSTAATWYTEKPDPDDRLDEVAVHAVEDDDDRGGAEGRPLDGHAGLHPRRGRESCWRAGRG